MVFSISGIDEQLARHYAHLFIRDPLCLFQENIYLDDEQHTDHFEVCRCNLATDSNHFTQMCPEIYATIKMHAHFNKCLIHTLIQHILWPEMETIEVLEV